jgi:hypothetical protein
LKIIATMKERMEKEIENGGKSAAKSTFQKGIS